MTARVIKVDICDVCKTERTHDAELVFLEMYKIENNGKTFQVDVCADCRETVIFEDAVNAGNPVKRKYTKPKKSKINKKVDPIEDIVESYKVDSPTLILVDSTYCDKCGKSMPTVRGLAMHIRQKHSA